MTEKEVKQDKARIKLMPIFPDHSTFEYKKATGKKRFTVTSSVRIHFENLWYIEVYLYPVETSSYIKGTLDKKELILAHLNRCLVISKYLMVRKEIVANLPMIERLDRKAEDFSERLWHYFP